MLLLAAILWGAAFVAQRAAMEHLGPLTFNAIRFAIGTLALLPFVAARSHLINGNVPEALKNQAEKQPSYLLVGMIAGLVLFVAATLQQAGMVYTTASKAGFITGLYVPLVPVFGLLIGERTHAATWTGAVLAIIGLYLLSINGPLGTINRGDALVIACAIVYAFHVLLIGRIAPHRDPLVLAAIQFAVVAVASCFAASYRETVTLPQLRAAALAILYGGLISVAIAYTLQVVGQRHAPPAHAALVLSLETVFAAAAGYCLLGERLGSRELCGAALMLGGMLLSQLARLRAKPAGERRFEVVYQPEAQARKGM